MSISKIVVILLCLIEIPFQLLFLILSETDFLDFLSLLLDFLILVALVGFAWHIPILSIAFWRAALVIIMLWQVLFADLSLFSKASNIGILSTSSMNSTIVAILVLLFLSIQIAKFIALYLYVFRSPSLWCGVKM